ncbi:hypothetical protein K4K52_010121 [Colletotrichum sp. SAR 10_76]|nr:hypothetical protein K4K52_010121 [Colletotrichum sp. SAR 10_76]
MQGKQDKQDTLNDASRWYETYHILFGDVSIGDLPSPYAIQTQYRQFLRHEIPNMIKRELEAEVAKSLKDTEPTMQTRLTAMIRNSVEKCAKIFEYIPNPSEAAPHGDPDDSLVVWPNGVPEFDFPVDFNFDALLNDFDPSGNDQTYNACFPTFDSAYETGSIGESSRNYKM